MLTYELAVVLLQSRGVEVYASNGDCLTATEDEMATAMRQIVIVFSQLEKHRLIKKMKAARDRIKAETGKCEGRKSQAEMNPAWSGRPRDCADAIPRPASGEASPRYRWNWPGKAI